MDIYRDENKTAFVHWLNQALLEYGGGWYEHLRDDPLTYQQQGGQEIVRCGDEIIADVTGDSLVAMLKDLGRALTD